MTFHWVSSGRISGYSGSMSEATDLAVVVGENARRIRVASGATMESVVRYAKQAGLKWTTARIVDLERGKLSPSLPTLLVLAHSLTMATRQKVTLADLVQHTGAVRINDRTAVTAKALASYLSGEGVVFSPVDQPEMLERIRQNLQELAGSLPGNLDIDADVGAFLSSYGLGDERAAKSLGIGKKEMMERALALWGHNLSVERDKRAGVDASAQRRGQITRTLIAELREEGSGDG